MMPLQAFFSTPSETLFSGSITAVLVDPIAWASVLWTAVFY